MKTNFPRLAVSFALILLLAACNLPQGTTPTPATGFVATTVAQTLVALTQTAQHSPLASPIAPTLAQPTSTETPAIVSTNTAAVSPTQTPTLKPTDTTGPTASPTPGLGTIAGSISGYPYGSTPSLTIVAFEQETPYHYWYLITGGGTYYSMDGYISTGNYQVVAYDAAGHTGGCASSVKVLNSQTVTCNISNWGSGYPAKPSGVPNP